MFVCGVMYVWCGVMCVWCDVCAHVQTIVRRPVREKGMEDWEVYDEVTTGPGIGQQTRSAKQCNLEVRLYTLHVSDTASGTLHTSCQQHG